MNVAFRRTSGALLINPSELGPTSRSPASRTISRSLSSTQDDATMSCSGPAGTTSNALAPFAAASAAKSRTAFALDREDHKIGSDLELAQGPHRPPGGHDGIRRVNQLDHTAEAAVADVLNQRAPDISRRVGGPR